MAIENTYLLGKNITLGCGFDLQAKAPLDSRQTVPAYAGLQALIDGNAAYEGMIVYDEETKKTYQAQLVDDVLAFREFGINEAELKDLIASETTAAMEFKGAATALPENPAKGDMYKVTATFKIGEEDVKVGDSIVYDGEQWFIIPSGDDIEDTWRPVTGVDNDATLTFVAGDKLEKTVAADGTITYKHVAVDAPELLAENEQTRTYITEVETDGFGHITGYKTATENVVNTDTTYEFEGQAEESSVYFQVTASDAEAAEVIYLDAYSKNEADGKFVAKEGYIAYTQDEKDKLAGLSNYDDEEVRGLIGDNADAIDALEKYVGTIPEVPGEDGNNKYADLDVIGYINKKAQETLAAAQGGSSETAASVKGQLDDYIGSNNTRVKAVEDDVAALQQTVGGHSQLLTSLGERIDSYKTDIEAEVEAELAKKVDKETYEADKATFAVAETVNAAIALKANSADVVANTTFEEFKTANTKAIADAKAGAVSDVEAKGYAVATEVEVTYATKTELGNVDAKFAGYNTTAAQKLIDDAQDARIKAIEDDYLVEADIANFETKENVEKVADDLAAYVESNDAALAAETKARTDADAGFETRIAALEGNFGDGEGTVEAQIAAAVKAEEDARKEAVKGVQDEVDAVEGRMDTAEGKITALETESAKHAIKTEVEGALALKADKSAVDEMYTNDQIDAAILVETNRAKGVEEGLQTQINTIMSNPDAEGAINSINEFTAYVNEHKPIAEAFRTDINKNKEDIAANAKAITDEVARAGAAEEELSGRIGTLETNANNYVGADATLKAELQKEIDDDVKEAIDAEVLRANAAYDANGAAADAQAAAIADAAGKYETKGTAQGIVDGLKLSETYEPIGAENRAIAAAKTETENQVKALAGEGNTSTVKKNADDIASIVEMLTWGSF